MRILFSSANFLHCLGSGYFIISDIQTDTSAIPQTHIVSGSAANRTSGSLAGKG